MGQRDSALAVLTDRTPVPEAADFISDFYVATVPPFPWGPPYTNGAFYERVCSRSLVATRGVAACGRAGPAGQACAGAGRRSRPHASPLMASVCSAQRHLPFRRTQVEASAVSSVSFLPSTVTSSRSL